MSSNRPLRLGRRHFLAGIGGFALAIPFLSSLEKPARAGGGSGRPRFFYLGTDHGGCWDSSFFPTTPTPNTATFVSGHTVSSGTLSATMSGGRATISPVLTASATALTSALVGKMNLLRGLDVPWYIAHNTGQHLGNFARNDGNGDDGSAVTMLGMRPTIDQFMANSPEFYTTGDLSSTTLKTMVMNPGRALSWAFSNPSQGAASPVQSVQGLSSSLQLFKAIFGGAMMSKPTRPPVVDKVLANYSSLRQGNTRLSAADKMRLDAHIAMLAELESSLNAQVACTTPATPTDDSANHENQTSKADAAAWGRLYMDVVAAAFACGASRIGVLGWGDTSAFSDYTGSDWHHDVAHQWYLSQPQGWLAQSYQAVFEQVFVYLAAKLDQMDDGNGKTVLDNTLLVWSQESGMETHTSTGVPVVTFGSAAGYLKTGLYCDYRNDTPSLAIAYAKDAPSGTTLDPALTSYVTYPGLLYEHWLATAVQSMGVPPSEFELWKDAQNNVEHGVGTPYLATESWYENQLLTHYQSLTSPYFQRASEPLPFLKA
jgi:hypothetical protein